MDKNEEIEKVLKKIKDQHHFYSGSSSNQDDEGDRARVYKERMDIYNTYKPYLNESTEEQNKRLREEVKDRSFKILWSELIFLGALILLVGFGHKTKWFFLNDWVIAAFSGGCLFQTFLIIRYIAVNLFPNNNSKANHKGETHIHHHHHK